MTLDNDRVRAHTAAAVLRRIDDDTSAHLHQYADATPEDIGRRLVELDREWDTDRAIELEATSRLLVGDFPIVFNGWDRPYRGVRTQRFTYVVYKETGARELYDRRLDPYQLVNVAGEPAYAAVRSRLHALMKELHRCKGAACTVVTS